MKSKLILQTVKNVTERKCLDLQTKSFELTGVEIFTETESSKIDFHQSYECYWIDVFDKELQKNVSLLLDFDGEGSVMVFVHFYKQKRSIAFWKKPTQKIVKTISYEVFGENQDADENINFVWDRLPTFLFNLND
jgi:hypothetical protein